ncbi:barstar family protein [Chryseobacterium sp. JUb7]|uniref:barstar family protein n=1 Tax=Chryseobacterium sp. JUb7 TaxID=2940599 RepID=UPI0038D48233
MIIQLDDNHFHNLDEFYCTLGEEVHGAGGYFGRQLYALYDCMRGDFCVKSVSELIWKNHKRSKKLFKTKFEDIIKIFEDHNIKITLE